MKKLMLAMGVLLILACHHDIEPLPSPADASRIEGDWVAMIPNRPNWHYHFHDGEMTIEVIDFNGDVTTYLNQFSTRNDSIFISNDHVWVAFFESDNVVQVTDIDAQVWAKKWLRRE